jgi:hypothetical protein
MHVRRTSHPRIFARTEAGRRVLCTAGANFGAASREPSEPASQTSHDSVLMEEVFGQDSLNLSDGTLALETLMAAIEPFAYAPPGRQAAGAHGQSFEHM